MNDWFSDNEKGAGLIEVLIVSVILLVTFQFLMQSFLNFNSFQSKKKVQMSQLAIKDYINEAVDCEKTMEELGSSCDPGEFLELTASDDETLVKKSSKSGKNSTKIGEYQVRAVCKEFKECEDCSEVVGIGIETRRVNDKNKAVKDPLTGKTDWVELYKKIPFQCSFE